MIRDKLTFDYRMCKYSIHFRNARDCTIRSSRSVMNHPEVFDLPISIRVTGYFPFTEKLLIFNNFFSRAVSVSVGTICNESSLKLIDLKDDLREFLRDEICSRARDWLTNQNRDLIETNSRLKSLYYEPWYSEVVN